MTTADDFTLILTKGTYLISAEAARNVRAAIERQDSMVEIILDPFGYTDPERKTLIAVGHIVALTKNPPGPSNGAAVNVASFRRRRKDG
jgi:hypothetical protein